MALKKEPIKKSPEQLNREKKEREFIIAAILGDKEKVDKILSIFSNMADKAQREVEAYFGRYMDGETGTAQNWQQRADKGEIDRLKRMMDKLLEEEELTEEARKEIKVIKPANSINRVALLQLFIGVEIIKGMSAFQKLMADVLETSIINDFKRAGLYLVANLEKDPTLWTKAVGTEFTKKEITEIAYDTFLNATWDEKIWGEYQTDLRNEVERLTRRGVINGENPKKIATELRKTFDASVADSERLMRTEERRVQSQTQIAAYKKQGFKQYLYIAEPDACSKCLPLDNGEPFNVSEASIGTNMSPMHPNCRCSTTPYIDNPI